MIKLDDNLLQELGLAALPPEEKKKMLAHIYETLEMRVGMELAKQMSDAQLSEFEEFINRNDEAGALAWLEANFPNYKQVVADEFEKLKQEIRQVAPQILASSQQAAMQQSQQPQQPPMMPPAPQQQYAQPPAQAQYMAQPQQPAPAPYPYQGQQPPQPQYGPQPPQPQQPMGPYQPQQPYPPYPGQQQPPQNPAQPGY